MVVVVVGGGCVVVVVDGGAVVGVVVGGAAGAEVVGVVDVDVDGAAAGAGVATDRSVLRVPEAPNGPLGLGASGTLLVVVLAAAGAAAVEVVVAAGLDESALAAWATSRTTCGANLGEEPPGATTTRTARSAPTAASPPSMPLRCEGARRSSTGSANSSWIRWSAAGGGAASPGPGSVRSSFILSSVPPTPAGPVVPSRGKTARGQEPFGRRGRVAPGTDPTLGRPGRTFPDARRRAGGAR